jgi:hypothetical protein
VTLSWVATFASLLLCLPPFGKSKRFAIYQFINLILPPKSQSLLNFNVDLLLIRMNCVDVEEIQLPFPWTAVLQSPIGLKTD